MAGNADAGPKGGSRVRIGGEGASTPEVREKDEVADEQLKGVAGGAVIEPIITRRGFRDVGQGSRPQAGRGAQVAARGLDEAAARGRPASRVAGDFAAGPGWWAVLDLNQ